MNTRECVWDTSALRRGDVREDDCVSVCASPCDRRGDVEYALLRQGALDQRRDVRVGEAELAEADRDAVLACSCSRGSP